MPKIIPLTASIDIERSITSPSNNKVKEPFLGAKLGQFANDVVEISNLAREKLQKEGQLEEASTIEDMANDVVRVSSTIGLSHSADNLSKSEATELYNKIADFL